MRSSIMSKHFSKPSIEQLNTALSYGLRLMGFGIAATAAWMFLVNGNMQAPNGVLIADFFMKAAEIKIFSSQHKENSILPKAK
jgi:cytochrome bd-type quinol oxidase subunit 1